MEDQQMRQLAAKATEVFMAQVWRERGKPLGTPVEAQLVQFEQELRTRVAGRLSGMTGDQFVELHRSLDFDGGPVWEAVRAVGIDPVYIGSHVHYRVTADGRIEKAPPPQQAVPKWPDNQELTQRRFLIDFGNNRWAVVDSDTGALYGTVKWEHHGVLSGIQGGRLDVREAGLWDVRDWEGLSLPFIDTPTISDSHDPSLRSRDGFANRLVYRADRKGGLPVPADPELAPGLVGEELFLRGSEETTLHVYGRDGVLLGSVKRTADGTWVLLRAGDPVKGRIARSGVESRAAAAAQLVEWGREDRSED